MKKLWRHSEVTVENKIRCYTELISLNSFEERFAYLKLTGEVGDPTFGSRRKINQDFYKSDLWKRIRRRVIIRDEACDLACPGLDICDSSLIHIHHMNSITEYDILNLTPRAIDPEYLICTRYSTHKAIHYGSFNFVQNPFVERSPNDTCPWKK